jgi:hypothetical protein
MNYRIMGLMGLICSPVIFIKLALADIVFPSMSHLIVCCNLLFDSAVLSTSLGFLLLSTAPKEYIFKLFCILCLSVSIFTGICDIMLLASTYEKVISHLENIRSSAGILICFITIVYLVFSRKEHMKSYENLLWFFWVLLSLIIFALTEANPALLLIQTIAGVVIGFAGYKIYMSDDPRIVNENMLYELSSL